MRECILCRHLAPIATPDRLTATLCATDRLTARLCAKASADLVPHRKERRRGTARICEKNSATCPEKSQVARFPWAAHGNTTFCNRHLRQAHPWLCWLKTTSHILPLVRQRRVTFSTTSVVKDWSVHVRASHGSRWTFPVPATGSPGARH